MSRELVIGFLGGFIVSFFAGLFAPLILESVLSAMGPWITPSEYRAYRRWRGGKWVHIGIHDRYWVSVSSSYGAPDENWEVHA